MKISLTQPTDRSTILIQLEFSDLCIIIHTSRLFDPYEILYIWLGQIRDSQLPASTVINEEGSDYYTELIFERASNDILRFIIDRECGGDTTTHLATTIKPDELLKAFHDGITEFIKHEYRPSDWSLIDDLRNINWGALLKSPTIPGQNWQKRLLMSKLSAYDGKIEQSKDPDERASWKQLTPEQQWSIVLRDVLNKIAVIVSNRTPSIRALVSLYRTLSVDIALGEIEPDWYEGRRVALNREYELDKMRSFSQQEKECRHILTTTRLKMLRVGQIVDGTVKRIKPYGLIVDIGGVNALLRTFAISQMPVEQLDLVFKHGDWVRAMIVSMDIERGRVSLSTSELEVEPGDMLKQPWKVYETATEKQP